ncbi:hypothetical protein CHS0354_011189 [Potamilus streckersoni]|uniref:15-oxoprostaglandin 13-reductase n=1 Tax=Potamilus streckersoni TaxID=2493646 RepID=A0AAE0S1E6_9BIVA|nr:hypothetical protein CHS0354_011189 [Potamilus streckersoni]
MATRRLPSTIRKLVATSRSQKFRDVVKIVELPTPVPGEGEILVRNRYLGINASEINLIAGRYDKDVKFPLDCGFEAMGEVVSAGPNSTLTTGQPVMYTQYGAFSEYKVIPSKMAIPIPDLKPDYLPFLVSGCTAAIALDKVGDIKPGETVLVTAAAGGTGQIAVQWAKNLGCHVIGTCSSDDKVKFLKELGCDRPINYSKEDMRKVLAKEYPNGVDIVYESIGGDMFDIAVNSLAVRGRVIVIGFITGYESDLGFTPSKTLATLQPRLLGKSASVRGFFLNHFIRDWAPYVAKQIKLSKEGKLKGIIDKGENTALGPFLSLEKVCDAVDYLYSKKSMGKIIVELNGKDQSKL